MQTLSQPYCSHEFQRVKLWRVDGDFEVHLLRWKPHMTHSIVLQPSLTHNRRPAGHTLPFEELHWQHRETTCPDALSRPKLSTWSLFFLMDSEKRKTSLILFNLTYTQTQLLPQRHVYSGGMAYIFSLHSGELTLVWQQRYAHRLCSSRWMSL